MSDYQKLKQKYDALIKRTKTKDNINIDLENENKKLLKEKEELEEKNKELSYLVYLKVNRFNEKISTR